MSKKDKKFFEVGELVREESTRNADYFFVGLAVGTNSVLVLRDDIQSAKAFSTIEYYTWVDAWKNNIHVDTESVFE